MQNLELTVGFRNRFTVTGLRSAVYAVRAADCSEFFMVANTADPAKIGTDE